MLLIDVGNSRIKWATWQNDQLKDYSALLYQENNLTGLLSGGLSYLSRQKVFLCSVSNSRVNQLIADWFMTNWDIEIQIVVSQKQQLGVVNVYENPISLGVDRWLGMVAAYRRHNNTAVCVIDCGTAVTLDVVDASGRHVGGLIMPGAGMMQQSLLMGTENIKSLQGEMFELACNTKDAVVSGCVHLLSAGLGRLYTKYSQQFEGDLLCVVTGGDGKMIANAMDVHCCYEEDLILYGLCLVAREMDGLL